MSFDEAKKDMTRAERHLAKIRSARAELEQAAADAHSRLEAALADRETALAAGRVGDLPRHGAILENARIAVKAATDDLEALAQAEHNATGLLVLAEKACKDALLEAWDSIADQARAELVTVAGPMLRRYWMARYHGTHPIPLGECLRSHAVQLREEIDTAAAEASDPAFPLPEVIESALLSHADRSLFQRHALG